MCIAIVLPQSSVRAKVVFDTYEMVGWCEGGPNSPAFMTSGDNPNNVFDCWEACAANHISLVAVDFWPNALSNGDAQKCWCQTACTGLDANWHSEAYPVVLGLLHTFPTDHLVGLQAEHFYELNACKQVCM